MRAFLLSAVANFLFGNVLQSAPCDRASVVYSLPFGRRRGLFSDAKPQRGRVFYRRGLYPRGHIFNDGCGREYSVGNDGSIRRLDKWRRRG